MGKTYPVAVEVAAVEGPLVRETCVRIASVELDLEKLLGKLDAIGSSVE